MPDQPHPEPEAPDPGHLRRQGESDAWGAFGLVVAGVLVWGGIGALVGSRLDSTIPTMIGLLVGMAGGLYLVWFRYGRP